MIKNDYGRLVVSFIILICGFLLNLQANSQIAVKLAIQSEYAYFGVMTQLFMLLGATFSFGIDLAIDYYIPLMHHFNKHRGIILYNKLYLIVLTRRLFMGFLILVIIYCILLLLSHYGYSSDLAFYHYSMFLLPLGALSVSIVFFYSRMIRSYKYPLQAVIIYQLMPYLFLYLITRFYSVNSYIGYSTIYILAWSISALIAILRYAWIHYSYFSINSRNGLESLINYTSLSKSILWKKSRSMKISSQLLISSSSDYMYAIFIIIFAELNQSSQEKSYAVMIGTFSLFFFITVRTISSICKPKMRLLAVTNPKSLNDYVNKMSLLGSVLAATTLLGIILFGHALILHFYGSSYLNAYAPCVIASIGFVLVEGLIARKLLIEQLNPGYAGNMVLISNLVTLILITIGSFYSLTVAMIGFVIGRLIYSFLILRWKFPLSNESNLQ